MEALVRSLEEFGFSESEARVYGTLLVEGVLSGSMVSQRTGLRRNVVDQSLAVLLEKQAVVKAGSGFRAKPLEEFVFLRQEAVVKAGATSVRELESRRQSSEQGAVQTLRGGEAVRKRALRMIEQGRGVILLGAAPEELAYLAPALRFAEMRGARVEAFCFGEPPAEYPEVVFHHSSDQIHLAQGGRTLLLSAWPEGLSAVLNDSPDCGGIWAGNQYLAKVVALYITHELFTLRAWEHIPVETRLELIRILGDIPSRMSMAGAAGELPLHPYLPGIVATPTPEPAADKAKELEKP